MPHDYTYVDGKRVSRHAIKDCRTFIKLQEAVGYKQVEARSQGYGGNVKNAPPATNKQKMELRKDKVNQAREMKMTEDTSRPKAISPQ
jgi:hypothetical protein